jgi:hypothetical protein
MKTLQGQATKDAIHHSEEIAKARSIQQNNTKENLNIAKDRGN